MHNVMRDFNGMEWLLGRQTLMVVKEVSRFRIIRVVCTNLSPIHNCIQIFLSKAWKLK
jgi:hypothetical protein